MGNFVTTGVSWVLVSSVRYDFLRCVFLAHLKTARIIQRQLFSTQKHYTQTRMVVQWTAEADRTLLLSFLSQFPGRGRFDHKAAAEAVGRGCTEKAAAERLRILRRMAGMESQQNTPENSPKKRKKDFEFSNNDTISVKEESSQCVETSLTGNTESDLVVISDED